MVMLISLSVSEGIHMRSLGMVEVQRMEPLDDPQNPYDETHSYRARRVNHAGVKPVFVDHRYGDGGWKLAEKALAALDIDTSEDTRRFVR